MDKEKKQARVTLRYEAWKIPAVKCGACRQTIRREGKSKTGDLLCHVDKDTAHMFRSDVCVSVGHILFLDKSRWVLNGEHIALNTRHALARADGFNNAFELAAFVKKTYGFPFVGTVIQW